MKATLLLVLVTGLSFASAAPAAAVHLVCPSLTPDPCELAIVEPGGSAAVDLYVHGGSNGADVTIAVANGFIAGFQEALTSDLVRSHPTDFSSQTVQQIRIAGVRENPSDPPNPLDPFHLGTLTVNVDPSSASASIAVDEGTSVGDGDAIVIIPSQNIFRLDLPEPAEWLLLTAGLLTLAALRRAVPRTPRASA
jgi:hypothetical protein